MRIHPVDNLSGERAKLSTLAGTVIAHGLIAGIAAVVTDTATHFEASAIDIDVANDAIFTFGATGYDTVTVIFARTNAITHGPVDYHRCRRWLY